MSRTRRPGSGRARDTAPPGAAGRRARLVAGAALAAVFLLKWSVWAALADHPLLQPSGELDAAWYHRLAVRVAGGDVWLADPASFEGHAPPPFFLAPLYIYALAASLAAGGGSLDVARLAQIALGTAAVGLLAATARRWYGTAAGWWTGALAAGCGLFTFYELLILQASLDPFLASLDLYLLTRALQDGRPGWWAAAGGAFGWHALNRPNMAFVAAGLAILVAVAPIARRRRDRPARGFAAAAVFLAAAAIAIAPAALRNWRVAGEFVPIASHGGLNLLIGNGPEADGTFRAVMGITPSVRGQWLEAPRVAAAAAGRPVSDPEASAFFRRAALDWIVANPADAAALTIRKVWYALSDTFLTLNHSYPFFARDLGTPLRALAAGPWLLVPLGLVGLVLARPRLPGFAVWAAFVPLAIASVAVFFVAARYRVPFQAALVVAAGGGAAWLAARVRARAWRALAGALLVAAPAAALALWPTGLDDGRAEERARMGLHEIAAGRPDRGEAWIARAVAAHGFPGVVHLRAGQEYEALGRAEDALRHYRAALAIDPDEPALHRLTGRLLVRVGRTDEAVPHLARAAGSGREAADHERLGLALMLLDRPAEALAAFTDAVALDPGSAAIRLNRAVALAALGRLAEARRDAETALALDPSYERARELLRALDR